MVASPFPQPFRVVLPNGIVVLITTNPVVDIIAAQLFLRAGSVWEAPAQVGIANLLAATLTKGTEGLSSLEIAEQVESMGAGLGADVTNDYFALGLKSIAQDFPKLLTLGAEILRSPTLPESEVDLERRITLQGIEAQREQPFAVAFEQLRLAMYGAHPYGYPSLGTIESVGQLTRSDLQGFHQTHFRPDQLVVSIAGNIAPEPAIALVERVFGPWPVPDLPLGDPPLPPIIAAPSWCKDYQETQQSIVVLGYLGASVQDPDYGALKILSTYLGNGMSSRLFVELREKRGLAYDVSALYPTRCHASPFVAYLGTAPPNTQAALTGLRQEITRLAQAKLTPEQLQACQNKLLGQYALGKQNNGQLAHLFGWYEVLGLGIGFDQQFQTQIAQLTPPQLQTAAQRYFHQRPFISLVGPKAILESLGEH